MPAAFWIDPTLASATRVMQPNRSTGAVVTRDIVVLMAGGALAVAAVVLVQPGLRIPGSAILRAAFPVLIALAVAPRRFGGCTSTAGGLLMLAVLLGGGWGIARPAAVTAALLLGPAMDAGLPLFRRRQIPVWMSCAIAGGLANSVAYLVRAGGWSIHGISMPTPTLSGFGWNIFASFLLCGMLSGLLYGGLVFRLRSDGQ